MGKGEVWARTAQNWQMSQSSFRPRTGMGWTALAQERRLKAEREVCPWFLAGDICVSNHRSHTTVEVSRYPGPPHNLCGNHSWSSSFLWQHLASSWIPKKVREHGYTPHTIITEEAYRARERKECSESSGGGRQASYCNHLVYNRSVSLR